MTAACHVNIYLYLVYLCHLIINISMTFPHTNSIFFTLILVSYCVFLLLMFPACYLCCFCRFLMALVL